METLNTIYTFVLLNSTEILLGIYILLLIHATYVIYKLWKENKNLRLWLKDSLMVWSLLIEVWTGLIKHNHKLEAELKETKEKRDKIYHKHGSQIAYFKKRVIAYRVAIKTIFSASPEFIILLQNEFYEHAKKNLTKLRKEEKELDKKKKDI